MLSEIAFYAFIVALAVAAFSDWRTRRIPNVLTVSGFAIALALRSALGVPALVEGLAGFAIAVLIMLPLFAMRGVGGGDAKLMMMVGAFLGVKGFLVALVATALFGGVMSLIAATRAGVVLPALMNTGGLTKWVFTLGRRGARTSLVTPGAVSVPYGVAIAAGSMVALYLGGGL